MVSDNYEELGGRTRNEKPERLCEVGGALLLITF